MAGAGVEEAVVGESFEFAFDKEAFSDKKLRVEVVGSDDAASRKRRREDDKSEHSTSDRSIAFPPFFAHKLNLYAVRIWICGIFTSVCSLGICG